MPKDSWNKGKRPRRKSDADVWFLANYKQTDKGLVYVGPRSKGKPKFKAYTGNEPIPKRKKQKNKKKRQPPAKEHHAGQSEYDRVMALTRKTLRRTFFLSVDECDGQI